MITWGDVIDITLYTFDLHKTDLSMQEIFLTL